MMTNSHTLSEETMKQTPSAVPETSRRNINRSLDIVVGTSVGTLASIGAVAAGRRYAPKQIEALADNMTTLGNRMAWVSKPFDRIRSWFGNGIKKDKSVDYEKKHAQSQADWVTMLGAGYVANTATQMFRRASDTREDEKVHDKWLWRLGGITTGWLGGAVGCWGAAEIGDRYLQEKSPHCLVPIKDNITAWLDRRINNVMGHDAHAKPLRVYFDKANPENMLKAKRLSTLLFDNGIMIVGAIPTNLITQIAYDAVVGKGNEKVKGA